MGTYRGTINNDTITPDALSPGVTADPSGTKPSTAADSIGGMDGNDVLNGVGGADTISGGNGNDDVYMYLLEDYEEITLSGTASLYGGGGNDRLSSSYSGPLIDLSAAKYLFFGEAGDDTLEATYHYRIEIMTMPQPRTFSTGARVTTVTSWGRALTSSLRIPAKAMTVSWVLPTIILSPLMLKIFNS
jgi:Ca2+-binding RTX toxin-like protein